MSARGSLRHIFLVGILVACALGGCSPIPTTPLDCATDNGGCGDPALRRCVSQPGAPPACVDIDPCATDNGGCGDPALRRCVSQPGAPPACADIDRCATDNGGCGHPAIYGCTSSLGAPPTCTRLPAVNLQGDTVTGVVHGLGAGGTGTVVLGNDAYLASQPVTDGETYRFTGVPDGDYFVKLEVSGHRAPDPWRVHVSATAGTTGAVARTALVTAPDPDLDFTTAALPGDAFRFHWADDSSRAGVQETAYINQPHTIVDVQGTPIEVVDVAAAITLAHDYNILLSDDGEPWTQELASRFLQTQRQLPQVQRSEYGPQLLTPSQWVLTKDSLPNDISVSRTPTENRVLISADAFVYAAPRLVVLDGQRATFFSKRLHHALTRYVTKDGNDLAAVEKILQERFGCTTLVPDFTALTRDTTAETASSFQAFHADELIALIDMFEELPRGFHAVTGLQSLVRRVDGMHDPRYFAAAAIAWTGLAPAPSYIEFMETAFQADPTETHRLILHEKAHFLWAYMLSSQLKADWIALGGWYPDPSDPDGWSTTKQVEFVSAYAHQKNPDEDMAESIAFFVLDPAALRSRSLPKYEFIRDRIMHGTQFLAHIQPGLTFEVLDLYPDYAYPGKINRVDIIAAGAPEDDKQVTVEIGLNVASATFTGADYGNLRVFSSIGTYVDVWLYPASADGSVLRGSFPISKYAKSGFWHTEQITLGDLAGNQRMAGLEDFGWKLYVDNPLEDVTPPTYQPGSLTLDVTPDVFTENGIDHPVQWIQATWGFIEPAMPQYNGCYAALTNPSVPSLHAVEAYGSPDPTTGRCRVDFLITEYQPSGNYGVPTIIMVDAAGNRTVATFASSPSAAQEPLVSVPIATTNPDTAPPAISLNDNPGSGLHKIQITGTPTHPEAPNGETLVSIKLQARDDRSGLWYIGYALLDPQGISHFQYFYPPSYGLRYFAGDPTAWTEYEMTVVLPPGSAPGTWGLQEITAFDKAGNRLDLNFVEILEFDVAQ